MWVQAGPSCWNLTHKHATVSTPSVCICVAWYRRLLMASLVFPEASRQCYRGTGFLTAVLPPCTKWFTLGLSGPFPLYVTHPAPSSCQAEGRATEKSSLLPARGDVFPGQWGHNPQSHRENEHPGLGGGRHCETGHNCCPSPCLLHMHRSFLYLNKETMLCCEQKKKNFTVRRTGFKP